MNLICRPRRFQGLLRQPSSPFLHRMRYGKAMLHLKENSAYGDRLRTNFFYLGCSLIADYNKQLPTNLDRWRQPGTVEGEEQIWRYLDETLRNAGFTLWTRFYASVFMSPGVTYPLSSGFGYAIPTRTDANDVGTVGTSAIHVSSMLVF